jgi:hypothetical protein
MFYSGYDKIDTHPDALIVRKPASGEEPLPALGTLVALTPTEDRRLAPRSTLRHIIFGPDNADSRDQFSRSTACANAGHPHQCRFTKYSGCSDDDPRKLCARSRPEYAQHTCGLKTPYSITSSARASREGGIVRPSAFAVLTLMTSSNLVGA